MLTKKQKHALELLIEGELNQKEIAAEVKVSEQTIVNWKKKDEFMNTYNDAVRHNIKLAAGKALKRELQLLKKADSDSVSLNAAKDILDRAGFKADSSVKINGDFSVGMVSDILKQLEDDDGE
ncbi:MAG: phBC6A51 family helix-turn-helix protein [Acetobacter sp.]|nr:phBC6A51 family helix-turn-helix protein [Bacteroides sp.]MCM1342127.1 phBC6A51 family helix-turn-helix protein [Acetobacter sp.]MCM1434346.1 phBC6A51 family helix-turn-helix protein [Clostridiales bacterium]